jgi:hypothetical protein
MKTPPIEPSLRAASEDDIDWLVDSYEMRVDP